MSEPSIGEATDARLGFYGKLPARGDFVTRRLPRSFVEPWDLWLQDSIANAAGALGDRWLDIYLEAPLWRFITGPGICGNVAMAGVFMPSVDRVGRYFPLTLAAPLDGCRTPTSTVVAGTEWFERVETLALTVLADDADFDTFDKASEEVTALIAVPSRAGVSAFGVRRSYDAVHSVAVSAIEMNDAILLEAWPNWAIWWTAGSERVQPTMIMTRNLPPASGFAAFLDGKWEEWGWATR
ncbi:MAG: type VI secretion system-associated protein TagF [Stellaceae bacterium]